MGICTLHLCVGISTRTKGASQVLWREPCHRGFTSHLQDLLIIPVNREDCSLASSSGAIQVPSDGDYLVKNDRTCDAQPSPEEDLIDITWKLSYSSRTPGQLISGSEIVPGVTVYDFAATSERGQVIGQDNVEMIRKLNGNHTKFGSDCIPF
jgi:hypothetical protein